MTRTYWRLIPPPPPSQLHNNMCSVPHALQTPTGGPPAGGYDRPSTRNMHYFQLQVYDSWQSSMLLSSIMTKEANSARRDMSSTKCCTPKAVSVHACMNVCCAIQIISV